MDDADRDISSHLIASLGGLNICLLGCPKKVERAVEVYKRFFGENPMEDINSYYISEEL